MPMDQQETLEKRLRLWDVYALATGAMFSSGFFLLPGLAAAETGPSVVLAYLVSGLIVLPTMFSMAELATALPRSGGTYYIIDRSLGPLFGTIGGIGSWLALALKSVFALIGMGAYLALFVEVDIVYVAAGLTVLLGLLNLAGAKETTLLQKILITALVAIMAFYILQGLLHLFSMDLEQVAREQFTPFFSEDMYGFFATVGMVFVSYAGLTKVASIAEEVEDPGRVIPLGMTLALATSVALYVLGVAVMVAVLDPDAFREDLTPVATAGEQFLDWLPGSWGLVLVVVAAVAAFASTGNAGIMSASRYPMAMSRDKLLWPFLSSVGRTGVPHWSVLGTVGLMLVFLLGFNVAEVAKLASAFQLLLFGLLNLAVIVMRESRIEEYDPAFRSPLYPWVQVLGILFAIILIFEMGLLPFLFTLAVCFGSAGWYKFYAEDRVDRHGAIFHVHAELGKQKDEGLEHEMRGILGEKGLRREDPYEELVFRAEVMEHGSGTDFDVMLDQAAEALAGRVEIADIRMRELLTDSEDGAPIPIAPGVALLHARLERETTPELVLARVEEGYSQRRVRMDGKDGGDPDAKIFAFLFLVSSMEESGQHLRILAHMTEKAGAEDFLDRWRAASDEEELREVLLREECFLKIRLSPDRHDGRFIGKRVDELDLPEDCVIPLIRRDGDLMAPGADTELKDGDRLYIIGEPDDIGDLREDLGEED